MKNSTKTILLAFVILFSSCDMGIAGNGNVTTENRKVNGKFSRLKASHGLNILLNESEKSSIKVEADENLQYLIKTEVEGNTLRIYATENIGRSSAKNIYVSLPYFEKITASSGCNISTKSTFSNDSISIHASSGSSVQIALEAKEINSTTSSGANVELSGVTTNLTVKASSGASVDTSSLKAQNVIAKASSGANIDVYSSEKIEAKASGGANIDCNGSPKQKTISESSGASISIN